ncbi:MAG: hypothetical protein HGN29_13495 [Asgard group archaeon]|nr:hypothetical protein [Asgard group archaeon]
MKTDNSEKETINEEKVIWEDDTKYYINNEETDHTTWFSSIMAGSIKAIEILETEKTGKNVLDIKNDDLLQKVKMEVKKPVSNEVHCLKCKNEFKIGNEVYRCSTCGCLYCKECSREVLFFRTEKVEKGTYCSNCF